MFPIAIIASKKATNDPSDLEFENGIVKISQNNMQAILM